MNVLLLLGTSIIQPRDLALGKDIDCETLIAEIQKKHQQAVKREIGQLEAAGPPARRDSKGSS
ncbi:MAG: hypothetical protein HY695_13360 [Deltaproteobacteria bacterium]|nr:hypothetical protein [Deltaproteobacteria bacterium]